MKASDQSLLKPHCCAAGHMAAGPGPSLRTAPASAIPKADDESAGGTPDVLILLLLEFAPFPACGSSEPDASWPWLGLRLPQASGLLCCFPKGLSHLPGKLSITASAPPASWVETDADQPKAHCYYSKKLGHTLLHREALATSPFKQIFTVRQMASHRIEDSQHQNRGPYRRLFLSQMYKIMNVKKLICIEHLLYARYCHMCTHILLYFILTTTL